MSNTDKSPQDIYADLSRRWERIAKQGSLDSQLSGITSLGKQVAALAEDVDLVRRRGYQFANHLESDAEAVKYQWPTAKRTAKRLQHKLARNLGKTVAACEQILARADKRPNLFDDVEREFDKFEREVDSAEKQIAEPLAPIRDKIAAIKKALREITQVLDALDKSGFELYPDEYVVAARPVETVGRNEMEGMLFLTEKRIIFEKRAERATKKRFFVTVESELVTEVEWEAPVGAVAKSSAEDKGGFLGFKVKDLLLLTFADGAGDVPEQVALQFTKHRDNEFWAQTLIPEVVSGAIEQQRVASAEDAAEEEWDASNLPTTCPNCMATLPPIFKGMHQVKCEFCGTLVNV